LLLNLRCYPSNYLINTTQCTSMWIATLLYTRAQFHQRSKYSFYARRSQKHKKILTTWLTLTLLGTTSVKSVGKYVGEINPRCQFLQHFTCTFFVKKFVQSQTLFFEKERKIFSKPSCGNNFNIFVLYYFSLDFFSFYFPFKSSLLREWGKDKMWDSKS